MDDLNQEKLLDNFNKEEDFVIYATLCVFIYKLLEEQKEDEKQKKIIRVNSQTAVNSLYAISAKILKKEDLIDPITQKRAISKSVKMFQKWDENEEYDRMFSLIEESACLKQKVYEHCKKTKDDEFYLLFRDFFDELRISLLSILFLTVHIHNIDKALAICEMTNAKNSNFVN